MVGKIGNFYKIMKQRNFQREKEGFFGNFFKNIITSRSARNGGRGEALFRTVFEQENNSFSL